MNNLEYYLNELYAHKVSYDKTNLVDWLSDVSYNLCNEMNVPTSAYNFRIQEEERLLQRTLFAAKQLYNTDKDYNGVNLGTIIRTINPRYMARRILNGDDNPFKHLRY